MQMLSRNFKNVKFLMNKRNYLFSTEQVSKGKLDINSLTKTFKDIVKRIDL
jgi:hypothetical protein